MGATPERAAPPGLFRVTGYDSYDYSDYFVGDYTTLDQAVREARTRASVPNAIPPSLSNVFLVYDDRGDLQFEITHTDLSAEENNKA